MKYIILTTLILLTACQERESGKEEGETGIETSSPDEDIVVACTGTTVTHDTDPTWPAPPAGEQFTRSHYIIDEREQTVEWQADLETAEFSSVCRGTSTCKVGVGPAMAHWSLSSGTGGVTRIVTAHIDRLSGTGELEEIYIRFDGGEETGRSTSKTEYKHCEKSAKPDATAKF